MDKLEYLYDKIGMDELCKHCEMHVICQSSNSYHFQCEGRFCEEAADDYLNNTKNIREIKLKELLDE